MVFSPVRGAGAVVLRETIQKRIRTKSANCFSGVEEGGAWTLVKAGSILCTL